MYSHADRVRAVELYIKLDKRVKATIRQLGYPRSGYAMVLFLAGLKSIPQDLYDAADIDGADRWLDRLRTVTLPMLGPVSMFVFIVVALKAFETFDTVQILTQGGPGHAQPAGIRIDLSRIGGQK